MTQKDSVYAPEVQSILSAMHGPMVQYHIILLRAINGDHFGAILLSRLLYWTGKGTWRPGWIVKTQAELTEETLLSRHQCDSAKRRLKKLGVLEWELRGVPARTHYRVNTDKLGELIHQEMLAIEQEALEAERLQAEAEAEEKEKEQQARLQSIAKLEAMFHDGDSDQASVSADDEQDCKESANCDGAEGQSISRTTPRTTPRTTSKESGAKTAPPVLDEVFPEQAEAKKESEAWQDPESLPKMNDDQKAETAAPGSAGDPATRQRPPNSPHWYQWADTCYRVQYPYDLHWTDIYNLALRFSRESGLAMPGHYRGIGQWRKGAVECLIAGAEHLIANSKTVSRENIVRHTNWAVDVLFARRLLGNAWTFDIVSPLSISSTTRAIFADLHMMNMLYALTNGSLPGPDQVLAYYSTKPGQQKTKDTGGIHTTERAIAELGA